MNVSYKKSRIHLKEYEKNRPNQADSKWKVGICGGLEHERWEYFNPVFRRSTMKFPTL